MTFKMLNEAYFVILYQKELENSDILGKIQFFMKISKISKSKLPKKCLFCTKSPVFRLFLMKYHKIYQFPSVFLQFCMIFDEFWPRFARPKSKRGVLRANPRGGYFAKFSTSGGGGIPTIPPLWPSVLIIIVEMNKNIKLFIYLFSFILNSFDETNGNHFDYYYY